MSRQEEETTGMDKSSGPVNFASIDVGSHTVRLLIAACRDAKEIAPVRSERHVTRLAQGFSSAGALHPSTMQASIDVLRRYAELIDKLAVHSVFAGATGVIRRAQNRNAFVNEVLKQTGIAVKIISEDEEALLSARGVLSVLRDRIPELAVTFDLGGSSTEFLLLDPARSAPLWSTSVFIGAATLTERYLRGDPTDPASVLEARSAVRRILAPTFDEIRKQTPPAANSSKKVQVVGTAGTVSTLAAMHLRMAVYQPYRVNGLRLTEAYLTETIDLLASMTISSRSNLAGLEKGREDIILGGALIAREILKGLHQDMLIVSDAGLLEGLLLDGIEREYNLRRALATPLTWNWQRG